MRIGVNALLLTDRPGYRQTGINRYVSELLSAIPAALPETEFIAFVAGGADVPAGVVASRARGPIERPLIRTAWEFGALPVDVRRRRIDLFHGMANALALGMGCPTVVTIHDLALLRWPEQVTRRRYRYLRWAIGSAAARATRIIAVSESTKRDVVDFFGVDPDRIRVTPLGVDARFHRPPDCVVAETRRRLALPETYILGLSTLEPRKNLPALLRAYERVSKEIPQTLVLAGATGWRTTELRQTLDQLRLGDRVRLLGFVDDADLPALYAGADLFAFPSLYEGFGLPALEAMACGTATLGSNLSSIPEITGDAAILIDPHDEVAIADGLLKLARDEVLRGRLGDAGRERSRQFTWRRTAELTADVYREALR